MGTRSAVPTLSTLATSPVELASGIDALYLSGKGWLPQSLLDELELLRSSAEEEGKPIEAQLCGYDFKVRPHAFGKYRYRIDHQLGVFGFTPSRSLPAVRVQPTAIALHAHGPAFAVLLARNVLDALGADVVLHVARLDLHSDWQGLWIDAEERTNFVTYSTKRAVYEENESLTGLSFGKRGGSLYARLYDKQREIEASGHDYWLELWGSRYDPEQPVLRVEFEFSRAILREFQVNTPEEAFDKAASLWAYATSEWLSLRVPTGDCTRSRWPVDPRWEHVRASALAGVTAPADRIREGEKQGQLRTLRKLATGVLSSMAAVLDTKDIDDTLMAVDPELRLYEQISSVRFADRVADKKAQSR